MTHKAYKITALTALTSATLLCCVITGRVDRNVIATADAMVEQSSEANDKAEEVFAVETTTVVTTKTPETTTTEKTTARKATTTEVTTTCITTTTVTTTESIPENQGSISLQELEISFDMDVSKPTGLSRDDFIYIMEKLPYDRNGYFSRNAGVIWDECNQRGVNEIFVCGITAWESGWAQVAGFGTNNYFGIRGGNYTTEADGIRGLVSLLADNYLYEGGVCYNGPTITGVGYYYCDPDEWPDKVYGCMALIVESI